jgi:hypothetical protein
MDEAAFLIGPLCIDTQRDVVRQHYLSIPSISQHTNPLS